MVDLIAKTACAGVKPRRHGGVVLSEKPVSQLYSVAPFNGADGAVSSSLEAAIGCGLPGSGRVLTGEGGAAMWSGQGQYFVFADALPALKAAVTDQSDAWAVLALKGEGAGDVLARLCPLDLRAMDDDDVARSLLGHMSAMIIRRSDGYELMVFRSMAGTALHELEAAMRSVAARMALGKNS